MRFNASVARFDLGGIPVVGNVATGCIVGLTPEGDALCGELMRRDVAPAEIPPSCVPLVEYLSAQGFFAAATATQPRLSSAYLHVTNTCNLSCTGCYSSDANRNRATDPTCAQLEHAVVLLAELGVERLVISGGEPFVRRDLPAVVRAARDAGIASVTVLTNGTLCTPERLDELAGLVDVVSVSFDGTSAKACAYVRQEQLFDRLVEAVRAIAQAGIRPHILPTLHAKNAADVAAYVELARSLGATVSFSLLSGSRAEIGGLWPDDACLGCLADALFAVGASAEGVDYDGRFDAASALAARTSCGAGRTGVSVASDGSIYPCHMLHVRDYRLGDAFVDAAEDVCAALRSFDLPAVDAIATCSSCGKRYLCGGGCRARAYRATGRLDAADPYCAYYDRALEKAVDAFVSALAPQKG